MSIERDRRYQTAVHRMQAAVGFDMEQRILRGETAASIAKHLRVGINSAMSDHAALVHLLVESGVISEEAYLDKVVEWAEREADQRVAEVKQKYNLPDEMRFV